MQSINLLARQNGVSLVEGARIAVAENAVNAAPATPSRGCSTISSAGTAPRPQRRPPPRPARRRANHVELAELILDESGYTAMWQNDKTPEAPGRLENLKELVKALQEFENLQGFLEHVSLVMDNESEEDAGEKVSIMTLHAAKGLEFPAVFLPGWEDGLFPSQRAMDETGREGLEEERRLAYVGITRGAAPCDDQLRGQPANLYQWQSSLPSRFVDELPADHVEVLTPPGLYGSQAARAGLAEEADDWSSEVESRAARASTYNSPGWRRMQRVAASAAWGARGRRAIWSSMPRRSRNSRSAAVSSTRNSATAR